MLRQHFGGKIRLGKLSSGRFYAWGILCHHLPPFRELTNGLIYGQQHIEQCTILPLHTRKTTGSVTTQGGGSSSHRNPKIDALHGQSPISLPPANFHQWMHYSWTIKYITVHHHSIYAPEKL